MDRFNKFGAGAGMADHTPQHATENSGACVVAGGLGASPGPILELWQTPRDASSGGVVNVPEGNQIAELNAVVASRIYQNVCLINGEQVSWRFSHRGRAGGQLRRGQRREPVRTADHRHPGRTGREQ